MSTLEAALQKFEATESNLEKLEKLWEKIWSHISSGPAFGAPPEYEELCHAFRKILPALPAIGGARIPDRLYTYDEAGQMRLDAMEVGEVEAHISVENTLEEQGRCLREYRFLLNAKRRELVRDRLFSLIDTVDETLRGLTPPLEHAPIDQYVQKDEWGRLSAAIEEIAALLGSAPRPPRWNELMRHLHYGTMADLSNIYNADWPAVKGGLRDGAYGEHDPLPVNVDDLDEVVATKPQGPVTLKLNWAGLTDEEFERLMFALIAEAHGYENPQWLQKTNAPDRGRDLSVTKVDTDPLAGVRRKRVIIQCRHWLTKSIAPQHVGELRTQMELWQPPRVDTLIIATTGRFTADAVGLIEQHNQADKALFIDMWPDSHLELLMAARPHLIAAFHLRQIS